MNASDWARFKCAGAAERFAMATRPPSTKRIDEGLSVSAVLAAWDTERTDEVLRRFLVPLQRVPGIRLKAVCVANRPLALDGEPWLRILEGSNEGAEFSAYDEGFQEIDGTGETSDVIIFLNDRALSYGNEYHLAASLNFLAFVAEHQVLTGAINSYGRTVDTVFGPLSTWCRTNLFVMSPSLARRVAPFDVARRRVDPLLPAEFPGAAWQAEGLGAEYGKVLTRWLTTDGAWYQATALTAASWSLLRSKVLAIINEQLLSVRCAAEGALTLPIRMTRMLAQGSRRVDMPDRLFEVLGRHPVSTDDSTLTPWVRVLLAAAIASARSPWSPLCGPLLHKADRELSTIPLHLPAWAETR